MSEEVAYDEFINVYHKSWVTLEDNSSGNKLHCGSSVKVGQKSIENTKRLLEIELDSLVVPQANTAEESGKLLKDTLFTDDEGALFVIANKFDLRHRNDKQHTNYDPAFRDWVFWWYLATIELTDRIRDRQ